MDKKQKIIIATTSAQVAINSAETSLVLVKEYGKLQKYTLRERTRYTVRESITSLTNCLWRKVYNYGDHREFYISHHSHMNLLMQ